MATETARSALPADVSQHLNTEDRVGLLRAMLMMRGIEEIGQVAHAPLPAAQPLDDGQPGLVRERMEELREGGAGWVGGGHGV